MEKKTHCFCGQPVVPDDVLCEKHLKMRQAWEEAEQELAEEFRKKNPDKK